VILNVPCCTLAVFDSSAGHADVTWAALKQALRSIEDIESIQVESLLLLNLAPRLIVVEAKK